MDGGLLRSLHEPDDLLIQAPGKLPQKFVTTAPVSVALLRHMMWKMLGADHPMEAHKIDSRGIYYRGRSADSKEGVESFLEKRDANYPCQVSNDMPEFFPVVG